MAKATLRAVKADEPVPASTPWGLLGFASEREMLLDDLRELTARIKSPNTTATAVAALSKRKYEILELITQLDSGDDPENILDDTDDEAWDGS